MVYNIQMTVSAIAKFEIYFLTRLFYARQNSMGAIDKQLMQSLKSKIEVIHQAPVPSIASVITLEMLPAKSSLT